jgi:hypothetical protein
MGNGQPKHPHGHSSSARAFSTSPLGAYGPLLRITKTHLNLILFPVAASDPYPIGLDG